MFFYNSISFRIISINLIREWNMHVHFSQLVNPLSTFRNYSRKHFELVHYYFSHKKAGHFMWIVHLADDSHEKKKKNVVCTLTLSMIGKIFSWQPFKISFLFFLAFRVWHIMKIVSLRDNLNEMPNHFFFFFFCEKKKKKQKKYYHQFVVCWICPECGKG